MPMSVAQPDFAQPGELEVELWDGEEVVKGQPTPRHEALRAALLAQLFGQRHTDLSVEVSWAIEEPGMAPRSDGSVLDRSLDPPATLVWVEVFSEADLRRGGPRLLGERRRRWLLEHGVRSLWAVTDVWGIIELTAFDPEGKVETFTSPATATVTISHGGGEERFVVDLGKLADAATAAGEE